MDPIYPKFFQTSFDIEHGGEILSLRGLVSTTGVTKIFLTAGLPPYWKNILGTTVNVRLEKFELKGVLLQQLVEHGTFFEIKFRELSDPMRSYIEQRLQADGISPGWKRQFPRIPVKGMDDPELPMPNVCMVRFVGQEIFVNVMNFTLGGIRIETLGDSLGELRVGSVLHFDLITTTGEIMANLSAEVRNIAVHDHKNADGPALTRSFGLRFVNLDPVNERKYRQLIRDYCTVLQKRLNVEK